ncbi:MAG: N-6 DNA methylase [Anaerolineae bacterium]|nr:N-6 DNA methylase [Anaerolineae bacterium]
MLDSETKRRIDSARDILVGKVPDPKSQVEQITIALIYKFMDDMDAEAEELGGKRSFFVGEYEKFSWAKLLSPALSGYDMLNLYGESIDKMTRNQGVPQLFRDIFKNAYLPYRDPETLKMFLKVINDFNYDHSEKLGDAFEYLLSVLGSQGDAGQFRTPRHIIDFMVKVLDPQKDESILDPACGTAGFLISAYKHVMASNAKDGKPGGALKPAERKKLADNIRGYDISPDMVRLSLVNLYLHGFTTPNIFEYDTLSSEENWDQTADVILANPPFMSPKGGIMPHKKFSVQSNRSEVLFVDYMAEHLTPNGRAAIIVPEGIIFQSAGAYKQLRKYLIEHNFLWAVVSLPAGAFNPYSGVKTSILLLDKSLAKKTDKVLFVKVTNDGFDLGAQRRPIDRNDLPKSLKVLKTFRDSILDGKTASFAPETDSALLVSISKLTETGDYNLSPDRYREVIRTGKQTYPMVKLGDVIEYVRGVTYSKSDEVEGNGVFVLRANNIDLENGAINLDDLKQIKPLASLKEHQLLRKNDILICSASGSADHIGKVAISEKDTPYYIGGFMGAIRTTPEIEPMYLYYQLRNAHFREHIESASVGANIKNLNSSLLASFQIPLPPLEIQRQLVDEIAAHQRIIDGARQVVEGWSPDIELELAEMSPAGMEEFPKFTLGEIAELEYGFTASAEEKGDARFIRITDINENGTLNKEAAKYVSVTDENKAYLLEEGDLLVARTGATYGKTLYFEGKEQSLFASYLIRIRFSKDVVLPKYYWYFALSNDYWSQAKSLMTGGGQPQFNGNALKLISLSVPPLEIQREIVARIETERAIVHGNRELIQIYEEKVKKVIERVWEG